MKDTIYSNSKLYYYKAVVVKIIDGDTIDVDIDLGFGVWLKKQRIRLFGIDAWEIRGKERPKGLKAKKFVKEKIKLGTEILIKTIKDKKGKYGRWLGIVYFEDSKKRDLINLNELLIKKGHAKRVIY